jgi:hypothetical protein
MSHRIANVALRYALTAAFLSAVADRLGLWGPPGTPNVDWGAPGNFTLAVAQLNPWLPTALAPSFAWFITAIEVGLAVLLIVSRAPRATALASGILLTLFAVAMAIVLGAKSPLNYSVFTAAAATFLLAANSDRSRVYDEPQ